MQLHVAGAAVLVSAGVHRHVARRGAGHQRAVHGVCHVRGHQHQRVLPAQAHHQLEHRHAHGHAGGQRGAGRAGAAGGRGLGVVQAAAAVLPAAAPAFAAQAQAQHPLARPRCAMGAHHTGGCRGGVGVVGVGVRWRAGAQGLEGHAQAGLRRPVLQVGPAALTAATPLEAARLPAAVHRQVERHPTAQRPGVAQAQAQRAEGGQPGVTAHHRRQQRGVESAGGDGTVGLHRHLPVRLARHQQRRVEARCRLAVVRHAGAEQGISGQRLKPLGRQPAAAHAPVVAKATRTQVQRAVAGGVVQHQPRAGVPLPALGRPPLQQRAQVAFHRRAGGRPGRREDHADGLVRLVQITARLADRQRAVQQRGRAQHTRPAQ